MAISSSDMLQIQSEVLTSDTSKNPNISFMNRLQTTDKKITKAINAIAAQSKTTLSQVTNLVKSTGTKDIGFVFQEANQGTASVEIYFPYDGTATAAYALLGTGNDYDNLSNVEIEVQYEDNGIWNSVVNIPISSGESMNTVEFNKPFTKGKLRAKVAKSSGRLVNVSVVLSIDISKTK